MAGGQPRSLVAQTGDALPVTCCLAQGRVDVGAERHHLGLWVGGLYEATVLRLAERRDATGVHTVNRVVVGVVTPRTS